MWSLSFTSKLNQIALGKCFQGPAVFQTYLRHTSGHHNPTMSAKVGSPNKQKRLQNVLELIQNTMMNLLIIGFYKPNRWVLILRITMDYLELNWTILNSEIAEIF